MIHFWRSLWRRRNEPPSFHGYESPWVRHWLQYHSGWEPYASVRIVRLPYDWSQEDIGGVR